MPSQVRTRAWVNSFSYLRQLVLHLDLLAMSAVYMTIYCMHHILSYCYNSVNAISAFAAIYFVFKTIYVGEAI